MEVLGVKKSSPGDVMNCSENPKKIQNLVGVGWGGGGVEVLGGQQIKSPGSVMNCPEKKLNTAGFYYIKLQKSLSVCPYPFFSTRPSDRNQIWHTYSGRYGTHSQLNKFDPAHPRGNITSYVTSSNVEYVRHLKTTVRRSMT